MGVKITKKMLKHIYDNNPVEVAAKKLGITSTWLYALLDQYRIPRKGYPRKIEVTGEKNALGKNKD